MIDIGHRVRELIQQIPGLKKSALEVQLYVRSTQAVEDLRHYIQHLRGGISGLPENSTPLWGVISWVSDSKPDTCFTLLSGTAADVQVYSCAYDTWEHRFAQKLILSVNNKTVDIGLLVEQIAKLDEFVSRWAEDRSCPVRSKSLPMFMFSVPKGHNGQHL